MKEETLKALHTVAWKLAGKNYARQQIRRDMYDWFCGAKGIDPDMDREEFSEDEDLGLSEVWSTRENLKLWLNWAIDNQDTEMLEWVGRNIPVKGDTLPEPSQRQQIAMHLICCLKGTEPVWFNEDWSKGRLPKRKEVADKLGIDIKKVSEFYAELAKETGLNLDERSKANVWS